MTSRTRSLLHLVVAAALALALGSAAVAQIPGTHEGIIFDENEKPVAEVQIKISDPERPGWEQIESTDKRGRFRIRLANAIVPYSYQFSKPGYQSFSMGGVKVTAGKVTKQNFKIKTAAAAAEAATAAGGAIDAEQAARGGATDVFNKGVAAFNSGDLTTAESLFLTALEKQPDLGLAHAALARLYLKNEDPQKAVVEAEKAVAMDADVESMTQVLFAGYTALGQTDKADQALGELKTSDPAKAALNIFNQAAEAYNSGDLAAAKSGLEQALSLDPTHGKANYLMGLVFLNEGDNAKAKAHLQKFLELAPNDPDAATAKEMLQYLDG